MEKTGFRDWDCDEEVLDGVNDNGERCDNRRIEESKVTFIGIEG